MTSSFWSFITSSWLLSLNGYFFMWLDGYFTSSENQTTSYWSSIHSSGSPFPWNKLNIRRTTWISQEIFWPKASTVWEILQVMEGSDKQFKTRTACNLLHTFKILVSLVLTMVCQLLRKPSHIYPGKYACMLLSIENCVLWSLLTFPNHHQQHQS